jgi:hypothetical protein
MPAEPKLLHQGLQKQSSTGMCQVVKKAGVPAGDNPISWSAGFSVIRWSNSNSILTAD